MWRRGVLILFAVSCCVLAPGVMAGFSRGEPYSKHPQRQVGEEGAGAYMSEICLGCICEATTNCNVTIGCSRGLCGPFFISSKYWTLAGMPVVEGDNPYRRGAYYACANDPYCSAEAVRGYMDRYAKDCDGDGFVSCEDFGRIHYLGGHQCNLSVEEYEYYKVFRRCLTSVQQLNG